MLLLFYLIDLETINMHTTWPNLPSEKIYAEVETVTITQQM